MKLGELSNIQARICAITKNLVSEPQRENLILVKLLVAVRDKVV